MAKSIRIKPKRRKKSSNELHEDLIEYRDPESWKDLSSEERETLAYLFLMAGEKALEDGELDPEQFSIAKELSPTDPYLHFREAAAYYDYPSDPPLYERVERCLKNALSFEPNFPDALNLLAKVWMDKGVRDRDPKQLVDADKLFEEIAEQNEAPNSDFSWCRGTCCFSLAKLSGEGEDYSNAIKHFRKALASGADSPYFLSDFANALVDFGCLIAKPELLEEATIFYQKMLKTIPDFSDGWLNLACTYQGIYEFKGQKKWFILANDTFLKISKISDHEDVSWFKWGLLLLDWGRAQKDEKWLKLSIEKFRRVQQSHPKYPLIMAYWAQAELELGKLRASASLLRSAERRVGKSCELNSEHAFSHFVWGYCLQALGLYFEDERYFEKAIEVIRQGLHLSPSNPFYWFSLARAYYQLGNQMEEIDAIEKSLGCFEQALRVGKALPIQFWDEWGNAWLKKGLILEDRFSVEQALSKFAKAIQYAKLDASPSPLPIEWLYHYGCALDLIGDDLEDEKKIEEAIIIFQHILKRDPECVLARLHLALSHTHLGETTGDVEPFYAACLHYEEVLHLDSEDEYAWYEWAVALTHIAYLTDEPIESAKKEEYLKKASSACVQALILGHEPALYQMTCILALSGDLEKACGFLERAMKAKVTPPIKDLLEDEWIEPLMHYPQFQTLIERA